ncbi:ribonuclease H-like domain-containing protein [Tanacetum coccineum]
MIVTTSRLEDLSRVGPISGPTSRYVVPTGRVKVLAGRYVVPTSKDNVIVSAGRSKVIPAGRTILVLKDEYETWAMKMEYWIMNSDHNLWNIVINGNSRKKTGRDPKGNIMILPPVSIEENIVVQRETKARTILLQSLPEDHMADFHHLDDARDIWLAVKARFGGNDESKKMRKSMLKQEFSEFRVSESEGLHKGYDRFQKILSQLNQMQAKPDNEDCNMKFLKALPPSWSQVAITLKTKGGLDYLSFDDLYNKLRTLEIDVKGGSSYDSRGTSAPTHSAFIMLDTSRNVIESVLHSFVAESDPQQQITYEDFDQIGKLDLEELDIKWQTVRINRFEKKARRKMKFNNRDAARFDKKKVKCYKCSELGHFARECKGKQLDSKARYSAFKLKELDKSEEPKALLSVDSMLNWSDHEGEDEEKGAAQVYEMIAGDDDDATGDVSEAAAEFSLMGVSSQKGTFMPPSNKPNLDDTQATYETTGFASCVSSVRSSSSKTNEHLASASSSVDFKTVAAYVPAGSRNPPASVSAGSAFPAGSRNRPASVSAGRPFSAGWRNHAARPMTRPTSHYFQHFRRPGDNPHKNKDLGIVDSGCSRSMTGNKEKLDDFVKIIGGTVTFGGGDGKITGKGTIRTSKLNFENVYYVEELQNFNLFSVSQICDKKNKVLFTDKECLVLTKEFQLPEDSQVVLRVPRRHNLYSFNLTEIQPARDITCLLAKASSDETLYNDHYVLLQIKRKGKQHKASYKAITAVSTISEPLQLLHMDLFGPTSIRSIDHKYYSLVVTDDLSSHLKPFGCHVTILNTSDHLGKFEGKADEGFIVGYAAHSKAYRVYNLSSKKIEETLNLRYLEDKPNVQGLGQEWYFDLDYLTDSLGYTRFKSNQPAGTQDPHIHAGTQDDSDSECDEQVIVVPSFPSNRFSGPKVHEASEMVESNSDYAEELARLQRQEHEAKDTAEKYGFGFSKDTEEHLRQADMVPAGSIDPAASISAGSIDPAASISAGSIDPAASISAGLLESILLYSYLSWRSLSPVQTRNIEEVKFGDSTFVSYRRCNSLLIRRYGSLSLCLTGEKLLLGQNRISEDQRDAIGIVVRKARWWLHSVRTATTSYEASKPKSKDEPDEPDDAVNVHLYRSMIGSLMYLIASRPDIMFAVSACSRHQVTPFDFQFECSQEIFKVSYKALKLGLCVKSKPLWLLLQLKQNMLQLLTVVVRIQSGWLSVSSGGARVPTGSFTGSYWFTTSYWLC